MRVKHPAARSKSPQRPRGAAKSVGPPVDEAAREAVINRAVEVFANEDTAYRWLGTPVAALEYATPVSLLGTADGRKAVTVVLHKIEHGVL